MEETQINVLDSDADCLLFKIFTNASLHAYHQKCYSMIESAFVLLSKDKSM